MLKVPLSTDVVWLHTFNTFEDFIEEKEPIDTYAIGGPLLAAIHDGDIDEMITQSIKHASIDAKIIVAIQLVDTPELKYEMLLFRDRARYHDGRMLGVRLPKPKAKDIIQSPKIRIVQKA